MSELGRGLRRVRAPNPGPMTGAGTNTYLLGRTETIVVDPGPAVPSHIEAILRHARGPIRWILVTHTHLDHSPAARELAARTGARLAGRAAPAHGRQDAGFEPDRALVDQELVRAAETRLRAIHTPGHASNHLCYWDPDSGNLFTGDHIIDGSTVVIDPPDGNMSHYLRSLKGLRALRAQCLMPGHGEPLEEPLAAIDALIDHRARREAKVLDALELGQAQTIPALLSSVYDDVATRLHRVAARSLLAHLLKLEEDRRVVRDGEAWRLAGRLRLPRRGAPTRPRLKR
jgi:glyoxylase-like metal-dependent hydrolase (beta-lactamase superfamily II)